MKNRHTRLLRAFALFLSIMMVMPHSALAETTVKAERVYSARDGMQYAASSSGLWLNEDGQLKWFQESAFEPMLVREENSVFHIAANENELFYLTEDAEGQKLSAVLEGGTLTVDGVRVQSESPIVQMEGVYALDERGCISSVYAYDGTLTLLSFEGWTNKDVTAFSLWESYLITYKAESGELTLLNIGTKQAVYPPVTVPSLQWIQVGAVSEERGIAFALDVTGDLLRISLTDGSYETLETNLPKDCAGLRRNEKNIYTLGKYYTELYALPIDQLLGGENSKTLTIVNAGGSMQFDAAINLFHEKYPDVNVVSRNIDDCRIVATEIMGGKEGIDLIGMQEAMMVISAGLLLKSGALLDLNQFEELTALKDEYRDIFGPVTISGHWYAVPQSYCQHPWQVNERLAEQIGWEIPTSRWTWDDFKALAEKVKAWNETAESPIYLLQDDNPLLPYFFQEYQANHVDTFNGKADYQSETYLELLRMWKQLQDDGLLYTLPKLLGKAMQRNVLLYAYRTNLPSMGQGRYIYPPTETLDSRIPVYSIPCIALNANTPHLEEAVYLLACYLSPEAASRAYYWNDGQLLRDRSLYNTEPEWGMNVSEENEALWNEMMTQGVPQLYLLDISRQQWNTLLPGLLEGTVSPEQFAAISQQLADMALGE